MMQTPHTPLVSVVMPVYNASAFLKEAIDSILKQSFADFELLLINDGSSDNSHDIMRSYSDPRIRILTNEENLGVTTTLNRGIIEAKGKYIARMDADDISEPLRFEKQVNYLKNNREVSVLACRIDFINTQGEVTGTWGDDEKYLTGEDILHAMASSNCIAHPSVMMDAELLKKYKYRESQKGAEDWDLWLRLLADGYTIHKLNEVLLHYRMHPASVMSGEKKKLSLEKRLIKVKKVFLRERLPHMNGYFWLVTYSLLRSIARNVKVNVMPELLRDLKRLLTISPFTASSQYNLLKRTLVAESSDLFFFFPYTHIGGAEKVHADITSVFEQERPFIIFTGFSKDEKFLAKFRHNGIALNIPEALNYPFYHKKCLRLFTEHLTKKNARILGANSAFFYELTERLPSTVRISDLIHAFVYEKEGNNDYKKDFASSQKFEHRIFISSAALEQFKQFCFHQNCAPSYYTKLELIYNYTQVPVQIKKNYDEPLRIVFVGRDSPEKRLSIFIEMAERLDKTHPGKFSFGVIGAERDHRFIDFMGEISDAEMIKKEYEKAHVLVLCSSREGFPLVVMEAMAHGAVPLCTPVGDIPMHIPQNRGYVTSTIELNTVIAELCEKIQFLDSHRDQLAMLSKNAHMYAFETFSYNRFAASYRSLFNRK